MIRPIQGLRLSAISYLLGSDSLRLDLGLGVQRPTSVLGYEWHKAMRNYIQLINMLFFQKEFEEFLMKI